MKKTVRLYVNDPMGKRCMMNMEAARMLRDELGVELEVIKKTSAEYDAEKDPPPCPSVAVGGKMVVADGVASPEQIRKALEQE